MPMGDCTHIPLLSYSLDDVIALRLSSAVAVTSQTHSEKSLLSLVLHYLFTVNFRLNLYPILLF